MNHQGSSINDSNQNITMFIYMVMLLCDTPFMKVIEHPIGRLMRDRLHYEVVKAREVDSRMRELAAAYNEYLDLREENRRRKARVENLLTVIGPWNWESPGADYTEHDAMRLLGIDVRNAEDAEALRSQFPLWRAMQEYLMFVPEARITEMEQFFDHVGYESANRQAMESALKRHPDVFKTRKRGGQKLISLKKGIGNETSSTN
jgi:hypothetical protein